MRGARIPCRSTGARDRVSLMSDLVLGPLLRHVDEHSATVWVETSRAARVTVTAGEHEASAPTFAVHGHHYTLVTLDGLESGEKYPYTVTLDGRTVWPPPDSPYPPSLIPTLDPATPLRLAFGSCRTSVGHDEEGTKTHGVDALRAYALRMAGVTDGSHPDDPDPGGEVHWPAMVLFLGDQVYADETTEEMRAFIESRRSIDEEPGTELKDYQEYAELYRLAWTDPANRWLLSTLPSAMIFDDHDIRDDWNTSLAWKQAMEATSWWHERVAAGLSSYWVYQHAGNLAPDERAEDELWREIVAHRGEEEYDATPLLDAFADRADQRPETYRWSYSRDFGSQARLVVVDSRAARVLDPEHRAMLDEGELAWLDERLQGGPQHVLIGTSLPFLLAPGLHYVEAFSEALAGGGWGRKLAARFGELVREKVDLEHWAAFQKDFQRVSRMVLELARGARGPVPRTITFLSGDVHHSYVSEARPNQGAPVRGRIIQAVCSPIRNPLSYTWRFASAAAAYGVAAPVGHLVARSAKVPDAPIDWRLLKGPWFDNNLATLEITDEGLRMWWATGELDGDDYDHPRLARVAEVTIT
jgi:hypothetical protein